EEPGFWQQLYYTAATGMRDFSLLRVSVLFVLSFGIIKQIVYRIIDPLVDGWLAGAWSARSGAAGRPTFLSSIDRGVLGAVTGLGRVLLVIAALFIFTTLF